MNKFECDSLLKGASQLKEPIEDPTLKTQEILPELGKVQTFLGGDSDLHLHIHIYIYIYIYVYIYIYIYIYIYR